MTSVRSKLALLILTFNFVDQAVCLSRTQRVSNGFDATAGQLPFQVQISNTGTTCGASLISNVFILGAAHCNGNWAKNIMARLGVLEWAQPQTLVPINEFSYLHNIDLAIYKLARTIDFNDHIQPVRLLTISQAHAPFFGQIGLTSGWGGSPSILQWMNVKFVHSFTDLLVTEKFPQGPRGIVLGDSGGPLVIYESGIPTLVGVTAVYWGDKNGHTHVGSELPWINEITGIPLRKFSFK